MSTAAPARSKKEKKAQSLIHLDIACGQNKQPDFVGIDLAGDADIVHDLTVFPWPIETESVDEAFCSHYVEHTYPLGGQHDGLILFMEELHRVLIPEGVARIVHPYLKSGRAFQDPTHTRFIPDATWYYFNKGWREANKLDHYPITANFDITNIVTSYLPPWDRRSAEAQAFALQHYWDVAGDLVVDLKKVA